MKLALKVDVDTFRGTKEGVLPLVRLLQKYSASATFLFSLGPDHTGWAIKRIFKPGFFKKVSRTSVLEHYGLKTLLYGTLIPGPHIGKKCADIMRQVKEAGFEVGIHTYDHVKWQNNVSGMDAAWTQKQMKLAFDRFEVVFKEKARVHGAAGWQMNVHAFRQTQRLGFSFCSDTRGVGPFIPVHNGEIIACPQIPTTLPTLDELIGLDGIGNVAEHLLKLSENPCDTGHVYTLHAEMEGMKMIGIFEELLQGWKKQGYEIVSMQQYCDALTDKSFPRHEIIYGEVPGRSGILALQGKEFLSE